MKGRRRLGIILCGLLLIGIWAAYTSCGATNTQFTNVHSTELGNPLAPASYQLLDTICGVINRCNPQVSFSKCEAGVTSAALNTQVGAPLSDSSFSTVVSGEQSGALVANSSSLDGCSAAINELTCSDPLVQLAFESASSSPFQNVAYMVPVANCGTVFSPPVNYACSTGNVFAVGQPMTLSPTNPISGASLTVSPALPAGLTLSPSTGIISGVPLATSGPTTYVISGGASPAEVTIQTVQGFVVNDMGDSPDQNPGDGTCATAMGTCTLRAALMEGNAATNAFNVILPAGTISVSSTLGVAQSANLFGACANPTILDGGGTVLLMQAGANGITISAQFLKFQNGFNNDTTGHGGGALNNSFYSSVTFRGSNLEFLNNIFAGDGGGAVQWGGIFNCSNCIFDGNKATSGRGGAMLLTDTANITQSLFVNNQASTSGGAIDIQSSTGTINVSNSTFYENSGANGNGAVQIDFGPNFISTNNTFVNNTSAGPFYAGAIGGGTGTTITLQNTLMANNSAARGNCTAQTIISNGGNLSYPSTSFCPLTQPTDLTVAPSLGPLQYNGGFSKSILLLPGSPGIDQAVTSGCPSVDQRGYPRLSDGQCDIGATETQ